MNKIHTLKQKIRSTALLAEDEKVDILAAVDQYSEHDKTELESIIDEYDTEHTRIIKTFERNMTDELDSIVAKADPARKDTLSKAAEQVKQGISAVTTGHLAPRP